MSALKSGSNLEKVFAAGYFAVTAELGPPQGTDIEHIRKKAAFLKGNCDAANVTDNQTAVVRMSSIGTSAIMIGMGLEPVTQMVCRDRNRIAMQSDLLGASALGVRNLLCLSGDHPSFGTQPSSKKVFDIDSTQLVAMVKRLRDEKKLLENDKELKGGVQLFIGCAANPFAKPYEYRALVLAKKVAAGADFVQTQSVFNLERFKEWMKAVRNLGLHEKCRIMAGVMPLKSLTMTKYLAEHVPGISIPEALMKRMAAVPKEKGAEEGIKICLETIEQIRQIPGVSGMHLMAIEWEHKVPEIMKQAGLLPRPVV